MFKSLKSMRNKRSPGNDGLSMEIYEWTLPILWILWVPKNRPWLKLREKKTKLRDSIRTGSRY